MAITLVYAPPKFGKTLMLSFIFHNLIKDRQRILNAKEVLKQKIDEGYPLEKYMSLQHYIFSNVKFISKNFGYSDRVSNDFNPFEIGLPNEVFKTRFFPEYSIFIWDECQKQLNSRKKLNRYTSAWFEQHGHSHYEIILATQRPKLVDLNVRDLITRFIDIRKVEFEETKQGVKTVIYTVEHEDCNSVERYIESGRKEPMGEKKVYKIDCDLRNTYDAFCYSSNYYAGFHDDKLKVEYGPKEENDLLSAKDYTAPKGYYTD